MGTSERERDIIREASEYLCAVRHQHKQIATQILVSRCPYLYKSTV